MRFLLFVTALFLVSCQQHWPEEVSETKWWLSAMDPVWKGLDRHKRLDPLLRSVDSLQQRTARTPYSRSRRFEVAADYHLFITRDYATALRYVDSALGCFPSARERSHYPRAYVAMLLFAGDLSYRLGRYDQANERYFHAKRLSDEQLPPCERSAYTYNVAMVLYRQRNYGESATYFREAFAGQASCAEQTTARALQQQEILSNIGLCNLHLGNYDDALASFDGAMRYAMHHRDSLGAVTMQKIEGVIAGNKAKVYLAREQYELAEPLLRKSIALNARPGFELLFAQDIRLDLARLLMMQSRFREADSQMTALRRDLDTLSNPTTERGWYELASRLAGQRDDTGTELRYLKRFDVLNDSLESAERRLISADLLRQLGEKELQLQTALLEQSGRRNRLYLLLLISTTVLAAIVMWLIWRYGRRSRRNLDEVKALNEQIRRQQEALERETARRQQLVMEAVIAAQEAERSVIGLELHDNVNQVLTTVKLHNEMARDGIGNPREVLERSLHYLQQCINEIRSLSRRLSAPTLGKISLCESVSELVQSINLTGKINIISDCKVTGTVRKDVHLAIYRILQEALNNILKHAQASEVRLALLLNDDGSITLTLTDNGVGLRGARSEDGIGVTNMRTRANSLGGRFSMTNAAGGGCRIVVWMPAAGA